MQCRIASDRDRIADVCSAHGVRGLAVFDAERVPGPFGLARIEREPSEMLGRSVDLRSPGDLSPYVRTQVLAEAETQYGAA